MVPQLIPCRLLLSDPERSTTSVANAPVEDTGAAQEPARATAEKSGQMKQGSSLTPSCADWGAATATNSIGGIWRVQHPCMQGGVGRREDWDAEDAQMQGRMFQQQRARNGALLGGMRQVSGSASEVAPLADMVIECERCGRLGHDGLRCPHFAAPRANHPDAAWGDTVPHMNEITVTITCDDALVERAQRRVNWWDGRRVEINVDDSWFVLGKANGDGCNCLIDTLRQCLQLICNVSAVRAALERKHSSRPTAIIPLDYLDLRLYWSDIVDLLGTHNELRRMDNLSSRVRVVCVDMCWIGNGDVVPQGEPGSSRRNLYIARVNQNHFVPLRRSTQRGGAVAAAVGLASSLPSSAASSSGASAHRDTSANQGANTPSAPPAPPAPAGEPRLPRQRAAPRFCGAFGSAGTRMRNSGRQESDTPSEPPASPAPFGGTKGRVGSRFQRASGGQVRNTGAAHDPLASPEDYAAEQYDRAIQQEREKQWEQMQMEADIDRVIEGMVRDWHEYNRQRCAEWM